MTKATLKDAKAAETVGNNMEAASEKMPAKGRKTEQQSVHQVSELAANAKGLFGTRQECVMTALKAAGKTECTVAEAKEIVGKFLKREVR